MGCLRARIEGRRQILPHGLGLARDLQPGVAQHHEARRSQGQIAAAVALDPGGRGMSGVTIELRHQVPVAPQRVDEETLNRHVHLGQRDAALGAEEQEALLQLAAGPNRGV